MSAARRTRICLGQVLVCILEVIDDQLHDLVVRTLRTGLDGSIVHALDDERHLVPHLLQLIIEMGTQEAGLGSQLFDGRSLFGIDHRLQGAVATRDGTIELIPQFVELTAVWL